MKVLSKILMACLVLTLVFACKNQPEGEAAKVGDAADNVATSSSSAKTYTVDNGTIYWTGTKVGGQHSGTVMVSRGMLDVENGNISSGKFGINMNSIKTTDDMGEEMIGKLEGHLKSDDFFGAAAHPEGMFEIVSVTPATGTEGVTHNITGNLTMKGITKSITIPANVIITDEMIIATTPKFTINRTDWDVKYGSGILGTAADKIIHDEVSLNLELKAAASKEG